MKRDDLRSVEALEAVGFRSDEAQTIVANPEVCPNCPHLMLFHDDQHGDEYPVYCYVAGCNCERQPPIF